MKTLFRRQVWFATFSLLLAPCSLLLVSCNLPQPQADSVRYFTLGGPTGAGSLGAGPQVRPVELAGHLHGRKMAVRVGEHEITYLEDVRWAEPLDQAIAEVLRNRLAPAGAGATVSVQVQRCELVRSEGNSVQLAATYAIVPPDGDRTAAQRGAFTASPRTWDGKDYAGLVGLLQAAVGELGDAIAAALPGKK